MKDSKGNVVTNAAPAALGTATHDTATLGGKVDSLALGDGTANAPNGATVTYEFFPNNDCSGETHTDQVVTVGADGSVPDANPQTLGAGSYSYLAVYSGNANYSAKTAACEPFIISKGTPSTGTTLHNAASSAVVSNGTALDSGSGLYDVATVTTSDSFSLSGTVTFQFFTNGTCTGTPASSQAGVALVNGSATSAQHLGLTAGNYAFNAQYIAGNDPNHNNSAVSSCEPFTINAPPTPPTPPSGTPAIGITKNPKGQTITSGGTATWTIVVTNTGTLTLSNVSVSDPLASNCNQSSSTIAALGLDGAGCERDLQLLARQRHGQLHQRRDCDGHRLERPDRDRERLGAGQRDHPAGGHPDASAVEAGDRHRQGSEDAVDFADRRNRDVQDHGHQHR